MTLIIQNLFLPYWFFNTIPIYCYYCYLLFSAWFIFMKQKAEKWIEFQIMAICPPHWTSDFSPGEEGIGLLDLKVLPPLTFYDSTSIATNLLSVLGRKNRYKQIMKPNALNLKEIRTDLCEIWLKPKEIPSLGQQELYVSSCFYISLGRFYHWKSFEGVSGIEGLRSIYGRLSLFTTVVFYNLTVNTELANIEQLRPREIQG